LVVEAGASATASSLFVESLSYSATLLAPADRRGNGACTIISQNAADCPKCSITVLKLLDLHEAAIRLPRERVAIEIICGTLLIVRTEFPA